MEDRELLLRKLKDGIALSQKRPWFLGFLSEEEAAVCADRLKWEKNLQYGFFGGYGEAERKILGLFPDFLAPEESLFPLTALTFTYRSEMTLSHRDFLGSFMSLGIERSTVGDILPGEGVCIAFFRMELADFIQQNLQKIGRVGVKISKGVNAPLPAAHEFETLSGVVASDRIDCMVAFLCRTGRKKAAELISAGLVAKNHRETLSVSEKLQEGDVLSIRKYGKFMIDRLGPQTAKGRLAVMCRKYK